MGHGEHPNLKMDMDFSGVSNKKKIDNQQQYYTYI